MSGKPRQVLRIGGRTGKTIRFRLIGNDQRIAEFLESLPEGQRSDFIRQALKEKIDGGATIDAAIREIREGIQTLLDRQEERP